MKYFINLVLGMLFSVSVLADTHFVSVANSNLAAGDVVSMHWGYNGKVDKFDATTSDRPLGIVEAAVSAGQAVSILTSGTTDVYANLSLSEERFASTSTPGGLTLTRPTGTDKCWSIGMSIASNKMYINPQPCHQ